MIVVTGSNGFIGSNFVKYLGDVYEIDIENMHDLNKEFFESNNIDMVIHNGAISNTTETNFDKIYKFNVEYTLNLIENCQKFNIPIKYASSASVYGTTTNYLIRPLNLYATSKAIIDACFVQEKWKNVQGFRYYNVYGNGEHHKGTQASPVTQFTKQARETGVIKVFEGSENYVRDFVCVEDIINIMMSNISDGIYDIGTSNPISFIEIAQLIAEKENAKIESIPFPNHLKGKYQFYTKAKREFKYNFKSVKEWLSTNIV